MVRPCCEPLRTQKNGLRVTFKRSNEDQNAYRLKWLNWMSKIISYDADIDLYHMHS